MTIVKRNLAANLAGAFWSGVVSVAMVPVYIRLLGIEAFALIGVQATLHSILILFDLGLSTTFNRELARLSAGSARTDAGAIVRTAEVLYWGVMLAAGAALFASAPLLATRWLDTGKYDVATVTTVLRLAAVTVMLQVPYSFYSAGLLGLQRHVLLNSIFCAATGVRAVGAVAILLFIDRDVRLLFGWFAVAAALQTAAAAVGLHVSQPGSVRRFDLRSLGHAWRFAAGVAAAGIVASAASQVDKITASRLLSLRDFGSYSLAGAVAGLLSVMVSPVQSTVFPRISQLVAARNEPEVALLYHRACQVLSIICFPLTATLAFFSAEVVFVWTADRAIAAQAQWPVALLVSGAAVNALGHMSHSVQLAHGWTRPALLANVVQLLAMVPLAVTATRVLGATGAAAAWLVLQISFLAISLTVTHRRTLHGHFRRWLVDDVMSPLAGTLLIVGAAKLLPHGASRAELFVSIAVAALLALIASATLTAVGREWLRAQWTEIRMTR